MLLTYFFFQNLNGKYFKPSLQKLGACAQSYCRVLS